MSENDAAAQKKTAAAGPGENTGLRKEDHDLDLILDIPLEVSVEEAEGWNLENRDRMGELFLRVALRTELNRSTAVDAAAGWGDDRKLSYTNGEDSGYAWVLRWDNSTEATEFEDAFRTYLGEKASEQDGVWVGDGANSSYRVERTTETTVVVFLGNDSFVRNATATEEAGEIVVEP